MDLELCYSQLEVVTLDVGWMAICMAKVPLNGKIERGMKENGGRTKDMEKEFFIGLVELNTVKAFVVTHLMTKNSIIFIRGYDKGYKIV